MAPAVVERFDQLGLLTSSPGFNFLLPRNCRFYVGGLLVVGQPGEVVFLGETVNQFVFMLVHAFDQVVSYTDVEVPAAVGDDLDIV